jgi:hypothetical protein
MHIFFLTGSGFVQQSIFTSASYYVAVGNLNSEEVEVRLQSSDLYLYHQLISCSRNVLLAINKDIIQEYLIASITNHR